MARTSSAGRDIPAPGAVQTTFFHQAKINCAHRNARELRDYLLGSVMCLPGLGQICLAPSDTGTAGTDLPPLPLLAHSLVSRVTFLLLLDALKLWNTHCPGTDGLGGAVAVMEVYVWQGKGIKLLSSIAVIKQNVSFNLH